MPFDPLQKLRLERYLLHCALGSILHDVLAGDIDRVKEALYLDLDVNARMDHDGRRMLHVGILSCSSMVEFLLSQGADPDAPDNNGLTPLHYAVRRGDMGRVMTDILLKAGANANARDKDEMTPLHIAAKYDGLDRSRMVSTTTLSLLVKAGANVMAQDNQGRTALDIARALKRHEDPVVSFLEDQASKVKAKV